MGENVQEGLFCGALTHILPFPQLHAPSLLADFCLIGSQSKSEEPQGVDLDAMLKQFQDKKVRWGTRGGPINTQRIICVASPCLPAPVSFDLTGSPTQFPWWPSDLFQETGMPLMGGPEQLLDGTARIEKKTPILCR